MNDQRFEDLRAVIDMAASRSLPAFIVRHASSMIDDLEREAHAMAVSAYLAAPPPVDMAPFVGAAEAAHVARPALVEEPEIKYPATAAASSAKTPRPGRKGFPTHERQCKICNVLASIDTPLERGQVERALADDGISAVGIAAEFAERGIVISQGPVWRHRAWIKKER